MKTWTTKAGRIIPLRDMELDHLCNTIAMLIRNARPFIVLAVLSALESVAEVYPSFTDLLEELYRRAVNTRGEPLVNLDLALFKDFIERLETFLIDAVPSYNFCLEKLMNRQTPYEFLRSHAEWLESQMPHERTAIADRMDPGEDREQLFKDFIERLETFLIDAVRLSPEEHPEVFKARDDLRYELRSLVDHVRWRAHDLSEKAVFKRFLDWSDSQR